MSDNSRDPIDLGPISMTFSVLAEDSGGTVTVGRCDVAAGAGVPIPHFHDEFEETIYGLEGTTTFTVDGREIAIGPGDTYCIRRGAVHSFEAGDVDAAFLAIVTPGVLGPEYFFEIRDAVIAGGENGPDPQAIGEVMVRHGLTPVSPGG
ncbi:MAG: cupin domain-containing protein [Solirubrobacterales bacterium]|nr:cupin domain-containing protein [Solirubrobacterales bacterium]